MKTIDFTKHDFETSMRGVAYQTTKRSPSQWETMCNTMVKVQRVYPEGHWPTEFARIAESESDMDSHFGDNETENMSFVTPFTNDTILVTDEETGEQSFVEITTMTNPYSVGIDDSDMAGRWLRAEDEKQFNQIKTSLANAGTMRYVNDVIEHMIKNCSTSVIARVYENQLLFSAMQRVLGKTPAAA